MMSDITSQLANYSSAFSFVGNRNLCKGFVRARAIVYVLVLLLGKIEGLVSDVVLVGKEESHLVLQLSAWSFGGGGGQGSTI